MDPSKATLDQLAKRDPQSGRIRDDDPRRDQWPYRPDQTDSHSVIMDENSTTGTDTIHSVNAVRLDPGACWALLRAMQVGRLGVVVDGRPEIFPVNYVVDHGSVVFRTAAGAKLAAATDGESVAFEADGLDRSANEAWSVLVKGHAEEIRDLDGLVDSFNLPLRPWSGSPKTRFVRVVPDEVTGRRFTVADPSVWDSPYTLRRPSPWE